MPVSVKPKEQQPLTTHADGAQKSIVSTKHEKSNKELQPIKLKQQYAKVQPMKSLSQQTKSKVSQKKPISSGQHVVTIPEMHNHDVLKQPVSIKSEGVNSKQSWQKKSQTLEKNVLSELQYNQEFPVSYKVISNIMILSCVYADS